MNSIPAAFFDINGTFLDKKEQIEKIVNETFREICVHEGRV